MTKNNLLITGAEGYIGGNLKNFLKNDPNYKCYFKDYKDFDISDGRSVDSFFSKNKIDCVVHLAAIQNVNESFEKPVLYSQTNILGTLNLLEACKKYKVGKFIFMSSITVHGKSDVTVREDSFINPKHFYGATKAAGEAIVRSYANKYDIKCFMLRPNLIVGKNVKPNFIDFIISEINEKGTYTIFGDGLHQRDWIHVDDVIAAIVAIIKDKKLSNETFCLGSNKCSYLKLARLISNTLKKGKAVFVKANDQSFSLCCETKRIRKLLKWRPKHDLQSIVNGHINKT